MASEDDAYGVVCNDGGQVDLISALETSASLLGGSSEVENVYSTLI